MNSNIENVASTSTFIVSGVQFSLVYDVDLIECDNLLYRNFRQAFSFTSEWRNEWNSRYSIFNNKFFPFFIAKIDKNRKIGSNDEIQHEMEWIDLNLFPQMKIEVIGKSSKLLKHMWNVDRGGWSDGARVWVGIRVKKGKFNELKAFNFY